MNLTNLSQTAVAFAWSMLWQSSLLIGVLFLLDLLLRRRVRAAVRHGLWLLVLVKLLLPPTVSLPTGLMAWWPRPSDPVVPTASRPATRVTIVSSGTRTIPSLPTVSPSRPEPVHWSNWLLGAWAVGLCLLATRCLHHTRRLRSAVRHAESPPPSLIELLADCQETLSAHRPVAVCLTERVHSPAVCGLFHPKILIPTSLASRLTSEQLRSVLLHELAHVQRGDLWVNLLQTLLQIVYWWHPLLWLAGRRLRTVREEATDERVLFALQERSADYADALLAITRFAAVPARPSLGLLGMAEPRSRIGRRIRRIVEQPPPARAALGPVGWLAVFVLGFLLLPMAPIRAGAATPSAETAPLTPKPDTPSAPVQNTVSSPLLATARATTNWPFDVPRIWPQVTHPAASRETTNWPSGRLITIEEALNAVSPDPLLETRIYRVNPETFLDNLRPPLPLSQTNEAELLRSFFADAGVSMALPNGIYYSHGKGVLMVRASPEDLERVEAALEQATKAPQQILIEAKFVEIPEANLRHAALSWLAMAPATFTASNSALAVLSDRQLRDILKVLESQAGTDLMAAPRLTTLSGRQAQIQVVELRPIVTGVNPDVVVAPGQLIPADGPTNIYTTETFPTGPTLDVVATASDDRATIHLVAWANVQEFLGYEPIVPTNRVLVAVNGQQQQVALPLPRIRKRLIPADATVRSGETLVLAHPVDPEGQPVERPGDGAKRLLVFVTAILVDPAGNPMASPAR